MMMMMMFYPSKMMCGGNELEFICFRI